MVYLPSNKHCHRYLLIDNEVIKWENHIDKSMYCFYLKNSNHNEGFFTIIWDGLNRTQIDCLETFTISEHNTLKKVLKDHYQILNDKGAIAHKLDNDFSIIPPII